MRTFRDSNIEEKLIRTIICIRSGTPKTRILLVDRLHEYAKIKDMKNIKSLIIAFENYARYGISEPEEKIWNRVML